MTSITWSAPVGMSSSTFLKTTELRAFAAIAAIVRRVETGNVGYKGKASTKLHGDFYVFDAQGDMVHAYEGAEWDCGNSIAKSLPLPKVEGEEAASMFRIVLREGTGQYQGMTFNNVRPLDPGFAKKCEESVAKHLAWLDDEVENAPTML